MQELTAHNPLSDRFDLRELVPELKKTKGGKYECICCGANDFSINKHTGAYQCFSGGCDTKEIYQKALEMSGRLTEYQPQKRTAIPPAIKPKPAPLPDSVELTLLPEEVREPNPEVKTEEGKTKTLYPYAADLRVDRVDFSDGQKKVRPYHLVGGDWVKGKGELDWPAYRESEVEATLKHGARGWLPLAEGEKCVEALRGLGVAAITLAGFDWRESPMQRVLKKLKNQGLPGICYIPDHDAEGRRKAEKVALAAAAVGLPHIELSMLSLWPECPEKGDIADWIEEASMERPQFIERLEKEIHRALAERRWEAVEALDGALTEIEAEATEPEPEKTKIPTPRQVGRAIAEKYRKSWAFHNEQKVWRCFNGKYWEAIEGQLFEHLVFLELESLGIDYNNNKYVEDVVKTLRNGLLVATWETWDKKRYIPFNNGILNLESMELMPHCPESRLTHCLPRDYWEPNAVEIPESTIDRLRRFAPKYFKWISWAMGGDSKAITKTLAIQNGTLAWKFHDLEMFIHLIGKPGTGKSTYARFLQKLVGKGNHAASTLKDLNADYGKAAIIDRQLTVCPDEDKQVGNFGGLKALTGGDNISYRQPYQRKASSPFYGSLVIISNNAIFSGDTTGLERRTSLVNFSNRLDASQRNSRIEDDLESELAMVTWVALSMGDAEVKEFIKGTGRGEIVDFDRMRWELTTHVSSAAAFLQEHLIHDPNGRIPSATLYQRYENFCADEGMQTMAKTRLTREIVEIASSLEWKGVSAGSARIAGKKTRVLQGVRLRSQDGFDDDIPYIGEPPETPPEQQRNGCGTGVERVWNGSDDLLESPDSKDFDARGTGGTSEGSEMFSNNASTAKADAAPPEEKRPQHPHVRSVSQQGQEYDQFLSFEEKQDETRDEASLAPPAETPITPNSLPPDSIYATYRLDSCGEIVEGCTLVEFVEKPKKRWKFLTPGGQTLFTWWESTFERE